MSHPLLRSGLLFAGANWTIGLLGDRRTESEDGILTALEASGLNLWVPALSSSPPARPGSESFRAGKA